MSLDDSQRVTHSDIRFLRGKDSRNTAAVYRLPEDLPENKGRGWYQVWQLARGEGPSVAMKHGDPVLYWWQPLLRFPRGEFPFPQGRVAVDGR